MEIIVRKSCPYSTDELIRRSQVGVDPSVRVNPRGLGNLRQMYAQDHSEANKAELEEFGKRPGRVPWFWEEKDAKDSSDTK